MTKRRMTALLIGTAAIGYDWKMNGESIATDADGNPVWITPDDREMSVKGDTISSLQGEAKRHRVRAEAAETKLAAYDGIDDPDAARQALDTVKDLKDGDLINKGKLDEVRSEITKQYETKISTAEQRAADAIAQRDKTLLDNAFNSSEFARSRLTEAGIDLARSQFGDRFKVEDGKVVAYDANGQVVYSDKNLGEPATFDEALEKTVGSYKYKDQILKAPDAAGTGGGGGGGQRGQSRTIKRSDFEKMPAHEQAAMAAKFQNNEVNIVD